MTLEQIVNTHPCPIIRGKIMGIVNVHEYDKIGVISSLRPLILKCIDSWEETKEGEDFWDAVYNNLIYTYSDLKHLDLSYVPEPAKPPVMWRKIDNDKLPKILVAAINRNENNPIVYTGSLNFSDVDGGLYIQSIGGYVRQYAFTHYIPLSDLINLPIED